MDNTGKVKNYYVSTCLQNCDQFLASMWKTFRVLTKANKSQKKHYSRNDNQSNPPETKLINHMHNIHSLIIHII